jgi:2-polyprenyl-6-methoxyphenol hydroxylase-like FAD-dependent oxidoreductase
LAAIEHLFPAFAEGATGRGAVAVNAASEVSWGVGGHRLARAPDTLPVISSTRPFLEAEIRRRAAGIGNIETVTGAHVTDFLLEDGRVSGVALERNGALGPERLGADLVVDATGRASRLPRWLADNGFVPPAEDSLEVDVGYATAHFAADYERLGGRGAVIVGATPDTPRGGVAHLVEGGMIEVSLSGYRGGHPPATREGVIAHARSLARPDIHRLIHDAELRSPIVPFHVARTVRRRYDALRRWPPGLVAIGDAVCAFNPIFAQGMSVAALEALALQAELRRPGADPRRADFARGYFSAAARIVAPAWRMARGSDLLAPHLAPLASSSDRHMARWLQRVLAAGAHDPRVARRFIRVACLVDPPTALLAPPLVARVLLGRRRTTTRCNVVAAAG